MSILFNFYFNKNYLKKHVKSEHDENEKLVACLICSNEFRSHQDLKRHQHKHDETRPYSCLSCDKSFSWPEVLKRHSKVHNEMCVKYSYDKCPRTFYEVSQRNMHQKEHIKGLSFQCNFCEKLLLNKNYLRQHVN